MGIGRGHCSGRGSCGSGRLPACPRRRKRGPFPYANDRPGNGYPATADPDRDPDSDRNADTFTFNLTGSYGHDFSDGDAQRDPVTDGYPYFNAFADGLASTIAFPFSFSQPVAVDAGKGRRSRRPFAWNGEDEGRARPGGTRPSAPGRPCPRCASPGAGRGTHRLRWGSACGTRSRWVA